MAITLVNGISLYQAAGTGHDTIQVHPTDPRFAEARMAYSLGLSILETPQGLEALNKLAKATVKGLTTSATQLLYSLRKDRKLERLHIKVSFFLQQLRYNPPELYLSNTKGEAMTVRYNWAPQDAGDSSRQEAILNSYNLRDAGHMNLNTTMVSQLAAESGKKGDMYNTLMFSLSIAVAHEIGHLLTGFFTGVARPGTPRTIKVDGSEREAGYYWEVHALGGIIECYADPKNPRSINQAGIPYLFPDGLDKSKGFRVKKKYIEDMVEGEKPFTFPIQIDKAQPKESRADLDKKSKVMPLLRAEIIAASDATMASGSAAASSSRDRYIQPSSAYFNPRGYVDPRGHRDPRTNVDPRVHRDPRSHVAQTSSAPMSSGSSSASSRNGYAVPPPGYHNPRGYADPRGYRDPREQYNRRGY